MHDSDRICHAADQRAAALGVLIATLSTVGIFLRLRTGSLAEIQLRLAALEEILAARPNRQKD